MEKSDLTRSDLILTHIVAFFGAIVSAVLVSYYFSDFPDLSGSRDYTDISMSTFAIFMVAYISCYVTFASFTKRVKGKTWGAGLVYGLGYCSFLGSFLGFTTGCVVEIFSGKFSFEDAIFVGFLGVVMRGLPIGIGIGLVFGPFFSIIINRLDLSSKRVS